LASARQSPSENVLTRALRATRPAIGTAIVFSFFINLLSLAAPLYMLQVYDRVLASRSISTLLFLTAILAAAYIVVSVLETLRSKVLIRGGVAFDQVANPDVFRAVQRATIQNPSPRHVQALRDMDTVREFYTGQGLIALCDFPWAPLFIAAAFLLHPIYGWMAVGAAVVSFALTLANDRVTKSTLDKASIDGQGANNHAVTTFRNAEVLQAMGMVEALRQKWAQRHERMLGWQALASNRAGVLLAAIRFNRMFMQSLVLGVGAYLVIIGSVTPGTMIAASIILGKALAPIEMAISQWKAVTGMRQAYQRTSALLDALPTLPERMKLPAPAGALNLEGVSARAPGRQTPVLLNVSLQIPAGAAVGIIGPSAAGKSSLARVIVGVWPAIAGAVRLDGSELSHWPSDELGRHIGYLPQDVELFSGTIAENISRFEAEATEEDILAAARMAGVHEMVQQLPEGYNTQLGEAGQALSGGQRQRIGLARALYRLPSLIVLDEPNASLDSAGEQALMQALTAAKEAGKTIIVITHKPNLLAIVDNVVVMRSGQISAAGPRDQILASLASAATAPALRPVSAA